MKIDRWLDTSMAPSGGGDENRGLKATTAKNKRIEDLEEVVGTIGS